ncbi:hypothetical protein P691DRAFT_772549 [Macrolepiota fuliginosa MF-IS2]|uniref:Uncharacterized protein n=1 Tax=Macrolepiota fuliginosa MF-IS2 TaxID=1400762 RepID=A0A9P5XM43_9AGAR|nr:hypothetical protein P691DRAFT_772549 [Macrolepiota fuliginosa MF-IS2]
MPGSPAATIRYTWTLIFLENAFYGGFFVLYTISSLLLYQRRKFLLNQARYGHGNGLDSADKERLQTMRFWEITGGIMFALVTAHWMLTYILYLGEPPDMSARMIVFAKVLLSEATLVVGDLVIIHRLWIVGNKSKLLIAFPLFAMVSFFVFAIPLSWEYYLVYSRKPLSWILRQPVWLMGVVASTLSVNVYCTVLMSWKIWRANRGARRYGGGQLTHVIVILVESAALYSFWMATVLGLLIARHPFYIDSYDIATELYGLCTMLISVRVGLGWATGDAERTMQSNMQRVSSWRPATLPPIAEAGKKSEDDSSMAV